MKILIIIIANNNVMKKKLKICTKNKLCAEIKERKNKIEKYN